MLLNPYLNFNGRCAEAFRFYEQCLGGTITMMMTHGETPAKDHVAAEWHDKIMHARLVVGGSALMGSDVPPASYLAPTGISVSLHFTSPAEAKRVFNALAQDGKVNMPFQETFWSPGFGMAVDRFGIPWMINCEPAVAAGGEAGAPAP